ncbi:endothelin-converting enzyme 2 [Drosophila ficusphila]|uniref:endothelin-converting enzyme 2 n=1 Tax=Drosophila ficusphila TaxID=30025 RepID=UPI0007E7C54E|nr:endothelin-converting enzyme 2 [Drosophila ficusphila]
MGGLLALCFCLLASLVFIQAEVDINIATANQIHKNLNRTSSPCTNFWNFACGGFENASKYVDNFEWVEDQFASAMVEFMESNLGANDPEAPLLINQMRSYYKACTEDKRKLIVSSPSPELLQWAVETDKFLQHGLNGVFFDERVDVATNDSTRLVIQIKMPDASAKYSEMRALELLNLYNWEYKNEMIQLVNKLQQLRGDHSVENPVVYTWRYNEIKEQLPNFQWDLVFDNLLGEPHTMKTLDHLLFEVSDVEYLREVIQLLKNLDSNVTDMYLRVRHLVLIMESEPRVRNSRTCIHHMRAFLPLGVNYIYDRFVYQNREQDNRRLQEILGSLKATFGKYLSGNRLQLAPHQLTYVRDKLAGIRLKVGNLPEEKSPDFYNTHYESANFTDSSFMGNLIQVLALRTRLQHQVLLKPGSRLDMQRYYVNDNVLKARTSPFYENERNTITVPMEFLQWPLFDHRQHSIFQGSLLGAVLGHEMNHAFEQEGILFDALGNESPVGLEIRESQAFRDAIKCAEGKPAVSLKERLADLNGLQLAYDSFFGLDHDSRKFEYRPYAFESEFTAPQLFHLSYAQFFCGSLPPVIAHDRDDERVNVSVGNLRQFAYDFKCQTSQSSVCEMWRPREESASGY